MTSPSITSSPDGPFIVLGTQIDLSRLTNYSANEPNLNHSCSPTHSSDSPLSLRRLTRTQYLATIESLMRGLSASELTLAKSSVTGTASLPNDSSEKFDRFDNSLDGARTRALFEMGFKFAAFFSENNQRAASFLKAHSPNACADATGASVSSKCLEAFIAEFGLRAFRRPVSPEERDSLLESFRAGATPRQGLSLLLFRALVAPQFLFHIEDRSEEVAPGVRRVSPYELAARLSYHFANRPPDDQLLASAASGELFTTDGYQKQVERLAQSDESAIASSHFFETWLKVNRIPALEEISDETKYLVPGLRATPQLNAAIRTEMTELPRYVTYIDKGTFSDLFLSPVHVARDPDLLKIYGVSQPAPAVLAPKSPIRLPENERAGLLTRAGFLASGSHAEHLVLRGVHVLTDLLCLTPPSPDTLELPDDSFLPPELDPSMTTRERWAHKTSGPQCASCHFMINAPGYALNSYNGLGQYRTIEAIFNENGQFLSEMPISSESNLSGLLGAGYAPRNGIELSQMIATHPLTHQCFAKNYFEYFVGRPARSDKDQCMISEIQRSMRSGQGRVLDTLKAVAYSKSFFYRN